MLKYLLSAIGDYGDVTERAPPPSTKAHKQSRVSSTIRPRAVIDLSSQSPEAEAPSEKRRAECWSCRGTLGEMQRQKKCQTCSKACHQNCLNGGKCKQCQQSGEESGNILSLCFGLDLACNILTLPSPVLLHSPPGRSLARPAP